MAKASRLTRSTGQPTEVSEGQVTGTSEMPPTGEEPSGHAESKPPASDPMSTPGTGQEQLPLSGIRVIDVGNFLAGPYAASILGEFGAEVLKIEHPLGGDPMRRFGTATARHDATLAWLSEARNRKSVTIDLRQQEGVALFLKLVAKSDILIENFRPGTMEEWGLSWPVLQATNLGLIMLRVGLRSDRSIPAAFRVCAYCPRLQWPLVSGRVPRRNASLAGNGTARRLYRQSVRGDWDFDRAAPQRADRTRAVDRCRDLRSGLPDSG